MSGVEREVRALRERVASQGPSPEDLAVRLARLQGDTPETTEPERSVQDHVLRSWLADPESFATWLGVSLFSYQADALGLVRGNDRVCLAWGRQCGKDHLTAGEDDESTTTCYRPEPRHQPGPEIRRYAAMGPLNRSQERTS